MKSEKESEKRPFFRPNAKFPGVKLIAIECGVSPSHLWYILNGQRNDPYGLAQQYRRHAAKLLAAK